METGSGDRTIDEMTDLDKRVWMAKNNFWILRASKNFIEIRHPDGFQSGPLLLDTPFNDRFDICYSHYIAQRLKK